MKKLFVVLCLLFPLNLSAQVEIGIMQYNLLYYGLETSFCTATNNNIVTKTEHLKSLISYIKPDILAVNEISATTEAQDYLLYNVFTLNGFPDFKRAEKTGSYIANQIYYNSKKFTLVQQNFVEASPRQFDIYKFYYNSPDLLVFDTAFFYYVIGHLAAGDTEEDARATAAVSLMATLSTFYKVGNYILSGDFNLYSQDEPAYQHFLFYSNDKFRFYDPLSAYGSWHDNENYAYLHTQSTNYYSGCAAGGGMDDRFDFILLSNNIFNLPENKIVYVDDSYKTIGQDALHFNDAINYNGNTIVPANILEALFNISDHLPIYLKLKINQSPITDIFTNKQMIDISFQNPVSKYIDIKINSNNQIFDVNYAIYDMYGRQITLAQLDAVQQTINIPLNNLANGMYILKMTLKNLTDKQEQTCVKKFFVSY